MSATLIRIAKSSKKIWLKHYFLAYDLHAYDLANASLRLGLVTHHASCDHMHHASM